jgi:alpha/beta superfamily hydrolase
MSSLKLWIDGPDGQLEARLRVCHPTKALAVLTHPHPQHGGTLDNPVVFHADRALHQNGFTTLRFNFRGVGGSAGQFDEGIGELRDLEAAVRWLRRLKPEAPLMIVGYSFGAWCAYRLAQEDTSISGLTLIGLPLEIYPFAQRDRLESCLAIVQPSNDEFGGLEQVQSFLDTPGKPARLWIVEDSTHLLQGRAADAARQIVAATQACLARLDV